MCKICCTFAQNLSSGCFGGCRTALKAEIIPVGLEQIMLLKEMKHSKGYRLSVIGCLSYSSYDNR